MAKKLALTPASVDALQKGLLADLQTPGLAIEVLVSGRKRWRYRRQVAGTNVMVTLYGPPFPAQTIAGAREWARAQREGRNRYRSSRGAARRKGARINDGRSRA